MFVNTYIPEIKDKLNQRINAVNINPLESPKNEYERDSSKVYPIGNPNAGQTIYDRKIAKDIINGGYILLFRHAHRDKWPDVTMYDALELINNEDGEKKYYKNAVCLSEEIGIPQAKAMGEFISKLNIPIGKVISSSSCRSRQTAKYTFGKYDAIDPILLHFYGEPFGPFDSDTPTVHFLKVKKLLLSVAPVSGKNTIISGHNNTIRPFMLDGFMDSKNPIDKEFLLGEGGFHVLKVVNGQLIYVTKFNTFQAFANKFIDRPKTYTLTR